MPRRRTLLNWLYDNDLQQFTTPSGQVVTLLQIAQLLQDQVTCSHDFAGAWLGWRIRQNRLIAPGQSFKASQITPQNLRAFSRWLRSFEGEQAQIEFHTGIDGHSSLQAPRLDAPDGKEHHASIAPRPPNQAAKEMEAKEPRPILPYEPRRREKVVQLADYRKRAR
jgi:hypothetical protein